MKTLFLMTEGIRTAWEAFVEAATAEKPLLLILGDLHWGDLPSLKLIDNALRHSESRPLAVIALARPEVFDVFPQLWSNRNPLKLPLPELSPKSRERLIRHVLGDAIPSDTVRHVSELSAGNAFYLEELIRMVADGDPSQLPLSVVAMIEARIDALSPAARRTLHLASVFGEVFWVDGVRALLPGHQREEVGSIVEHLVESELFTPSRNSRFANQKELVFRHALVREAAYQALSESDATAAHGLVAEWLVAMGEGEAVVLAEHYERAGQVENAAAAYVDAAAAAVRAHDWKSAVVHARKGLALGPLTDLLVSRLRVLEGEALAWQGIVVESAEACTKALEALRKANVPAIESCATLGWAAIMTTFAGFETQLTLSREVAKELIEASKLGIERADYQRAVAYAVISLVATGEPGVVNSLLASTATQPRDARPLGWWHFHRSRGALMIEGDNWKSRRHCLDGVRCFETSSDRSAKRTY